MINLGTAIIYEKYFLRKPLLKKIYEYSKSHEKLEQYTDKEFHVFKCPLNQYMQYMLFLGFYKGYYVFAFFDIKYDEHLDEWIYTGFPFIHAYGMFEEEYIKASFEDTCGYNAERLLEEVSGYPHLLNTEEELFK